jgi:hypothetical protein
MKEEGNVRRLGGCDRLYPGDLILFDYGYGRQKELQLVLSARLTKPRDHLLDDFETATLVLVLSMCFYEQRCVVRYLDKQEWILPNKGVIVSRPA